jgi:hypothetical protein
MASTPLQGEQRQNVLAAVWNMLRANHPELFAQGRLNQPGGIMMLDTHLDALVEMSRQMTADRIEPYLARIIDDICAHCPEQDASGHCPLRHVNSCVLFSQARLILETIDAALSELRDPEYLASHGT